VARSKNRGKFNEEGLDNKIEGRSNSTRSKKGLNLRGGGGYSEVLGLVQSRGA